MKTSGQYVGGKLRPECFETWAQCLVDYCARYERMGFRVLALSVQNEPRQLPLLLRQKWETMFFEPDELARLSCLVADLPGSPKLLLADDQRKLLQWLAEPSVAAVPAEQVWGAGVHSYQWPGETLPRGTARALLGPGKPIIVSEFCTGYHGLASFPRGRDKGTRHAAQYARDLICSLRNGEVTGYVDWNLCLDEAGGPNWAGNNVDSLAWRDDEGQLRLGYTAWVFAHVAAFGAGSNVSDSSGVSTISPGHVPLVVCFADKTNLYVTVFNDAWFGTQSYVLAVRGRFLHDSLGHRCTKTYIIKKGALPP
jgi:O-glycosyl hydrolase